MINKAVRYFNTSDIRRVNEIINYDERSWRLSYLKTLLDTDEHTAIYEKYYNKINHGYLVMFLILQAVTSGLHLLIIIIFNMKAQTVEDAIPDILMATTLFAISFIGIFLNESSPTNFYNLRKASLILCLSLFAMDTALPIYHSVKDHLSIRPAYTSHLIIACYIFFTFSTYTLAALFALIITFTHLMVLGLLTYDDSKTVFRNIGCDTIYCLCLNGLGLYFRYIHEIVYRKGFIDRRMCIEANLNLEYQKDQEMQFMTTILPKRIVDKVLGDIHTIDMRRGSLKQTHLSFKQKFFEKHINVTILYADIVNYTQMTTKLKPRQLVLTLNELFGSFDDASEALKVLRIKFLGDCYYCVAGLPPDKTPHHADACVLLGIQMIAIIKKIQTLREIDIDMRIGIHTGDVIGGIIGHTKFQYDVWSKDVFIANRMETTGTPGKLHVTEQTLKQLMPEHTYTYTESPIAKTDPILVKYDITAYLITPPLETPSILLSGLSGKLVRDKSYSRSSYSREPVNVSSQNLTPANRIRRASALDMHRAKVKDSYQQPTSLPENPSILSLLGTRMNFMSSNANENKYQHIYERLSIEIDNMPLSKFQHWFHNAQINTVFLIFTKCKDELSYINMPDPLFTYYLITVLLILFCIFFIQLIIFPFITTPTLVQLSLGLFVLFVLIPLSWTHYIWNKHRFKKMINFNLDDRISIKKLKLKGPKNKCGTFIYNVSKKMGENVSIRIILYLSICSASSACVLAEMMHCNEDIHFSQPITEGEAKDLFSALKYSASACIMPWHFTQKCALTIIMSFLFFKIHVLLKLLYGVVVTTIFSIWILTGSKLFFMDSSTSNRGIPPPIAHILNITYITLALCLIDRQSDYMNRVGYLWNRKLEEENALAKKLHDTNRHLLKNIVPIHVAEEFFSNSEMSSLNRLYYEEYAYASVMFASIVNFNYDDFDDAFRFLQIMHDIISEFDKILLLYEGKIEKIKIANWTYMAASGLSPGTRNVSSAEMGHDRHLVRLLNFASDILKALDGINAETLMDFKLRIGICHGHLTAGVVGCKKPFYDIWGRTVNMASRLDSTGLPDNIQIDEETSKIVMRNGYTCRYRGLLYIKGISKSPNAKDVPTYFMNLNFNKQLITGSIQKDASSEMMLADHFGTTRGFGNNRLSPNLGNIRTYSVINELVADLTNRSYREAMRLGEHDDEYLQSIEDEISAEEVNRKLQPPPLPTESDSFLKAPKESGRVLFETQASPTVPSEETLSFERRILPLKDESEDESPSERSLSKTKRK